MPQPPAPAHAAANDSPRATPTSTRRRRWLVASYPLSPRSLAHSLSPSCALARRLGLAHQPESSPVARRPSPLSLPRLMLLTMSCLPPPMPSTSERSSTHTASNKRKRADLGEQENVAPNHKRVCGGLLGAASASAAAKATMPASDTTTTPPPPIKKKHKSNASELRARANTNDTPLSSPMRQEVASALSMLMSVASPAMSPGVRSNVPEPLSPALTSAPSRSAVPLQPVPFKMCNSTTLEGTPAPAPAPKRAVSPSVPANAATASSSSSSPQPMAPMTFVIQLTHEQVHALAAAAAGAPNGTSTTGGATTVPRLLVLPSAITSSALVQRQQQQPLQMQQQQPLQQQQQQQQQQPASAATSGSSASSIAPAPATYRQLVRLTPRPMDKTAPSDVPSTAAVSEPIAKATTTTSATPLPRQGSVPQFRIRTVSTSKALASRQQPQPTTTPSIFTRPTTMPTSTTTTTTTTNTAVASPTLVAPTGRMTHYVFR